MLVSAYSKPSMSTFLSGVYYNSLWIRSYPLIKAMMYLKCVFISCSITPDSLDNMNAVTCLTPIYSWSWSCQICDNHEHGSQKLLKCKWMSVDFILLWNVTIFPMFSLVSSQLRKDSHPDCDSSGCLWRLCLGHTDMNTIGSCTSNISKRRSGVYL